MFNTKRRHNGFVVVQIEGGELVLWRHSFSQRSSECLRRRCLPIGMCFDWVLPPAPPLNYSGRDTGWEETFKTNQKLVKDSISGFYPQEEESVAFEANKQV